MDEDPSNEAFVLSLLEGYGADEGEAMDTEPAPRAEDWRTKYFTWMDRGELLSYGPPCAHYLGGYQDRLLGGPLGDVEHKDYTGVVLG
jgi:hypothetical protein